MSPGLSFGYDNCNTIPNTKAITKCPNNFNAGNVAKYGSDWYCCGYQQCIIKIKTLKSIHLFSFILH